MRVIVAGMHRSGTTWLFNTVRLAALESGRTLASGFGREITGDETADIVVWKTHHYRRPRGATVLQMYRDLRGVAASAVRRGLVDEAGALGYVTQAEATEDRPYRNVADLRLQYETMMRDKVLATARVLETLELVVDPQAVHEAVEALEIPETGMDPETHLHANHVTSGEVGDWRPLGRDTLRAIEERFQGWLEEHGYGSRAQAEGDAKTGRLP